MSTLAIANAWADQYKHPSERAIAMGRLYIEQGMTLQEIGDEYGITRERVRQIIEPFGFEPHHGRRKRGEREATLRDVFERIYSGASSVEDEYRSLGYSSGDGLRNAFYALGLRLRHPAEHGTDSMYRRGCKCDECRRAHRESIYAWRETRGVKEHGLATSYFNYGCRCVPCKEAASLQRREQKARRRQARITEHVGTTD
jgi:hypothetical protein